MVQLAVLERVKQTPRHPFLWWAFFFDESRPFFVGPLG